MAIAKKAAAILTAASMLVAPVAASAASANAAVARANAETTAESTLGGEGFSGGTVLLVAVIAGMLYAAYELIDGDDSPASP